MELEKWIQDELTKGVEVNRLFPCKYSGANGFGYEIMLSRTEGDRIHQYKVILTRKDIKQLTLLIAQVYKVNWYSSKDEYKSCLSLEGKQVRLNPKETSTYACEVSPFTITGTLTLESKPT